MANEDDKYLMPTPPSRKRLLLKAARSYRDSLNESTVAYLHGRGFDDATISHFGFGYVENPVAEHQRARGMLAIPYITPSSGIKAIRFRCIEDHVCKDLDHGKYWGEPGVKSGMFHTRDLVAPSDTIAVCEGELDAITISGSGLMPAVGIPGANGWHAHFSRMLAGFSKVILVADGDDAGHKLASTFRRSLPTSGHVILCEQNEDVNSTFIAKGREGLASLLKGEEEE